jgi:hypothetical protein
MAEICANVSDSKLDVAIQRVYYPVFFAAQSPRRIPLYHFCEPSDQRLVVAALRMEMDNLAGHGSQFGSLVVLAATCLETFSKRNATWTNCVWR